MESPRRLRRGRQRPRRREVRVVPRPPARPRAARADPRALRSGAWANQSAQGGNRFADTVCVPFQRPIRREPASDGRLRVIVHRGARQIGGSCIEVSSGPTRIILDAGLPLAADLGRGPLIPPVAGLFGSAGQPVDGLFLSHAHADHSGLIAASRTDVPVWMTAGTSKMMLAGGVFALQPEVPRLRRRTLVPGKPTCVGNLTVTALPVDHSVYDAMAFLVENGQERLLYTGDLRFHGRKPGMARQLVAAATAAPLDILVIEGTRLGGRSSEPNLSEAELEQQITADLRKTTGAALAMYSPLNVDRFVTFLKAARAAGRTFVIDPYQSFVLHLIGRQTRLRRPGAHAGLRVMVPPRFAAGRAGRRLGHADWARRLGDGAIDAAEILQAPEKFVVLYRQSMQPWLFKGGLPHGATVFFSYWPGYLEEPRLQSLVAAIERTGG
ncbi:MAG: MBL fold metallo-hydrolase [Opitutaceae bacterium]